MAAPEPSHRSSHVGPERPASLDDWTVSAGGLVAHPSRFTWEALLNRPGHVDLVSGVDCPDGIGTRGATYTGVPLVDLIEELGPAEDGAFATVTAGAFTAAFALESLGRRNAILAVRRNGTPLTWEEGGPVRLVVEKGACFDTVKWVQGIGIERDGSSATALSIVKARRGMA